MAISITVILLEVVVIEVIKMHKLFPAFLFVGIASFPSFYLSSKADSLYRTYPQGGAYGGSAYTDSYGNIYNDSPHQGGGLYGGGVIYDHNMNEYDCTSYGECFKR